MANSGKKLRTPGAKADAAFKAIEGLAPDKQRLSLFAELAAGRLDPEQAEALAMRFGMKPLNPQLDETLYDPMLSPTWTLAMAVAWISWRRVERVRESSPEWRKSARSWYWRNESGWQLESTYRGLAPLLSMQLEEAIAASEEGGEADSQLFTIKESRRRLWEQLTFGHLTGVTIFNEEPQKIPAEEWPMLDAGEHEGRDALYLSGFTWRGPRYDQPVHFSRSDILAIWPLETPKPTFDRKDIIRAGAAALNFPTPLRAPQRDEQLRAWIKENHPAFQPPPSRTQIGDALRGTRFIKSRK